MSENIVDGWGFAEDAFHTKVTPEQKLRFLLRYAVLAPSSRNTQPWLFKIEGDAVELYADRTRSLPVIDPHDRELTIACGAALQYLLLAIRHFGYAGEAKLFPNPGGPDLLARVRLDSKKETAVEDETLFQAMPKRHTNRLPFRNLEVPEWLTSLLQADAKKEGAWLSIINDANHRYPIADLIAEADHVQWADQGYRSELADWVRPNRSPGRDGLPGYALGMEDLESGIAPLIMETFDLSKTMSSKDYKLAVVSPVLAVLGTRSDKPQDWLATGQAIARVLLRSAAEGVSAAFFNQPVEVPKIRVELADIIGTKGFPQLLMRMGYGPEVKPTPRRAIGDVLLDS